MTVAITRKELWNGNKESLRLMFFDKESLLLWGINHHGKSVESTRAALATDHSAEVFEMRSPADVEALVRRFVEERRAAVAAPAAARPSTSSG